MNKLIFRKFSLDILNFFLIASFSITFIVWIIQAVNLLDLVSDDGHSLKIYFYYVSLNFPKIFSKTIIFVFFISIFYVINKLDLSKENCKKQFTPQFVRLILVGTHTNELIKNTYGLALLSIDCVNVLRGAKKTSHLLNLLTITENYRN